MTIEGDGQTFRLDDALKDSTVDCADTGRANFPIWSPDGRAIAFFASPASVGREGADRTGAPWQLYLMDVETQAPRSVLRDVFNIGSLAVASDWQRAVFSGRVIGRQGAYSVALADGATRFLAEGSYIGLDWSPDGRALLASKVSFDAASGQLVHEIVEILTW